MNKGALVASGGGGAQPQVKPAPPRTVGTTLGKPQKGKQTKKGGAHSGAPSTEQIEKQTQKEKYQNFVSPESKVSKPANRKLTTSQTPYMPPHKDAPVRSRPRQTYVNPVVKREIDEKTRRDRTVGLKLMEKREDINVNKVCDRVVASNIQFRLHKLTKEAMVNEIIVLKSSRKLTLDGLYDFVSKHFDIAVKDLKRMFQWMIDNKSDDIGTIRHFAGTSQIIETGTNDNPIDCGISSADVARLVRNLHVSLLMSNDIFLKFLDDAPTKVKMNAGSVVAMLDLIYLDVMETYNSIIAALQSPSQE